MDYNNFKKKKKKSTPPLFIRNNFPALQTQKMMLPSRNVIQKSTKSIMILRKHFYSQILILFRFYLRY